MGMAATVTYDAYRDKKLNEVIMLGSHDAGITKGNANTRTQIGGILAQANAGARFFDVRVAGFYNARLGATALRTYHDELKVEMPWKSATLATRSAIGGPIQTKATADRMKIHGTLLGAKGEGLHQILMEARQFVTENTTEFLMLKFDKSENWPQIADACIEVLDTLLYKTTNPKSGNLNEQTLRTLEGKVIVLFDKDGYKTCGKGSADGILQWANRYNNKVATPGTFESGFFGLQYYGKGGVSRGAWGSEAKIKMNADIQSQLLKGAGAYKTKAKGSGWFAKKVITKGTHTGVNPKLLGLMYWTTTGVSLFGIKDRNKEMWTKSNQQKLVEAATGMALDNFPINKNPFVASAAAGVKALMPNIIMVDFVTANQAKLIRALNDKSAVEIFNIIST